MREASVAGKAVLAEEFHSHLASHVLCAVCGLQSFSPSCLRLGAPYPSSLIATSAAPDSPPAPTATTPATSAFIAVMIATTTSHYYAWRLRS